MNFQRIILIVAIILLILCLILIGMVLVNSKSSQQWPPMVGDCPDYTIDTSGNGGSCVNIKNLGSCNFNSDTTQHQTMDFTQPPFTGSNGLCSKYKWATGCQLSWDGITYGAANPCDASGNNQ